MLEALLGLPSILGAQGDHDLAADLNGDVAAADRQVNRCTLRPLKEILGNADVEVEDSMDAEGDGAGHSDRRV